jgi:hypothetical protein
MQIVEFRFQRPEWTNAPVQESGTQFDSEDARMRFVVELSRRNVFQGGALVGCLCAGLQRRLMNI